MAGRMRWIPTGLVIIATAALGEFSCSEEPTPPHNRHTISHPAGLWMGSSLRNEKRPGLLGVQMYLAWATPHHRTLPLPHTATSQHTNFSLPLSTLFSFSCHIEVRHYTRTSTLDSGSRPR